MIFFKGMDSNFHHLKSNTWLENNYLLINGVENVYREFKVQVY